MFRVWSPRPSIAVSPLAVFTLSTNTRVYSRIPELRNSEGLLTNLQIDPLANQAGRCNCMLRNLVFCQTPACCPRALICEPHPTILENAMCPNDERVSEREREKSEQLEWRHPFYRGTQKSSKNKNQPM